jgi:hypothetical protein
MRRDGASEPPVALRNCGRTCIFRASQGCGPTGAERAFHYLDARFVETAPARRDFGDLQKKLGAG